MIYDMYTWRHMRPESGHFNFYVIIHMYEISILRFKVRVSSDVGARCRLALRKFVVLVSNFEQRLSWV